MFASYIEGSRALPVSQRTQRAASGLFFFWTVSSQNCSCEGGLSLSMWQIYQLYVKFNAILKAVLGGLIDKCVDSVGHSR